MQTPSEFRYVGSELDLFAAVVRWKAYWSSQVRPYLCGDVLEVGAGIGSNTRFLNKFASGRWVCLEPDPELVDQLGKNLKESPGTSRCEVVCGTVREIPNDSRFDTVLYIDVLEHIEDDAGELNLAGERLRPGGRIVVLSPAHQQLYTAFDAAIGHFRRYDRQLLREISPPELSLERLFYLDSCGILLSAANRLLLRQAMPTKDQLAVWDRWVVPMSRVVDPVLMHRLGKSIVGVCRRPTGNR